VRFCSVELLGFYRGLVDEHDGNVVFDWVNAVAICTFQGFRILAVFERFLAGRTNQNFQQFFAKHGEIVREKATAAAV
jgi:hypothetical protein